MFFFHLDDFFSFSELDLFTKYSINKLDILEKFNIFDLILNKSLEVKYIFNVKVGDSYLCNC